MIYSYRIEQAIRAAAVLHQDQFRHGSAPYPYVTHLFAVSFIIADYSKDEDVIISGLLHDSLEDTDYTPKELEDDFGPHVRTLVEGVSESVDKGDERSWLEKKEGYLQKLKKGPEECLIISAADKIHNMRSVVEEYQLNKEAYIKDFGGSIEDRVIFYQKLSNLLNRKLKNDIVHEFNHVFDEYKKFAEHAHES